MLKQNSFLKTHLFYWFTQSQYKVQNKTSGIDIRGQQFKSNHRLYFELCFQLLMLKRTVSQNKTRTFRATWGALTYRYRYGLWIIGGTLLAVWPEKIRQMSVKVAQKWFHQKNDTFWHLYKNGIRMWEIWAIELLPNALKSWPKSNTSPNLVTLLLWHSWHSGRFRHQMTPVQIQQSSIFKKSSGLHLTVKKRQR